MSVLTTVILKWCVHVTQFCFQGDKIDKAAFILNFACYFVLRL